MKQFDGARRTPFRGTHQTLQILNTLRQAIGSKASIAQLLDSRYGGKIPPHTGAGIFGAAIATLLDTELIKLQYEDGTDITEEIRTTKPDYGNNDFSWGLDRGYPIAAKLAGKEAITFALLTERMPDLQAALGISITQLMEEHQADWIRARPVFGKPRGTPSADVFVLMPFSQEYLPVYEDHIKKVCEQLNLRSLRADDMFGSKAIINDVWELISNSTVLIADCTGRNPNVFYELGIAHTLGKRVIIIAQAEADIPFDIRHIRYIRYEYTPRGMKAFEELLSKYLAEPGRSA